MSLKYTSGKAGQIKYLGKQVTVWKYDYEEDLLSEFKQLGRWLDNESIAWVESSFLIFQDKVVAKTTKSGQITWLDNPKTWTAAHEVLKAQKEETPQTSRGKRRELPIVEDRPEVDVRDLWKSAVRTDWEAVMVKTSW